MKKNEHVEEKAGEAEVTPIPEEEIVEDLNPEPSREELLQQEIEKLQAEVSKLKNDYALAYADTENMKKRLRSEAEQTRKYRIQSFALEVLPVLDNLERALAQEAPEEAQAYVKGVEMTYEQLKNALVQEGVQEIDCLGKPFDAAYQQAIMTEKQEGTEPGIVLQVLQKGYMLKDRILRAAMVKVSA